VLTAHAAFSHEARPRNSANPFTLPEACHFLPRSCKNAKENYMRFSHGCQALVGAQYLVLRA
ncbi:hypothetical protein, partial [Mesorhizobium sp.]|uniref:hypothetical protein n=1 Tax=Mesorhizobium sp. TaxID=1871066 RepID=UPI0025EE8E9E